MEIEGRMMWQVAAGDTDRNYADLCLRWDVILNGPGSAGPWPECQKILQEEWGLTSKKISDIRRFSEELADGDIVALRMGTNNVLGVGVVVGGYIWNQEFGDVDGWNLQHLRRVRWLWKADPTPKSFETYALKFGDTTQILDAQPVKDWIASLTIDSTAETRALAELPEPSKDLKWEEIYDYLFDHGVSNNSIKNLTQEIDELTRIAKWYQRAESGAPSEAETITYLVAPLLRALGWTPQRMAIEWRNVDLALFRILPRTDANISVVVEAKQKDRACLSAQSQALSYAQSIGSPSCNRLIVTDGLRYGVYLGDNGDFQNEPHAYLNLTSLREDYPVLQCQGAKDALLLMSADWAPTAANR